MDATMRDELDGVPRKSLKAALRRDRPVLNSIENELNAGDYIVLALESVGMSQKEAATTMGIPDSQFTRQLRGQEHLSWQRLFKLPDTFWRELWMLVAERRKLARVKRSVVFEVA
jgi:plasmid maintenance system antidote protein VapI